MTFLDQIFTSNYSVCPNFSNASKHLAFVSGHVVLGTGLMTICQGFFEKIILKLLRFEAGIFESE
jgi:hypothetical protein